MVATPSMTSAISGPLPLQYVLAPQIRQFNAGVPGGWGGQSLVYAMAFTPLSVASQVEEHPDWFEQ